MENLIDKKEKFVILELQKEKEVFSMEQKYFDVFYMPGESPVFCYRSGMLVYEEKFMDGTLLAQGYNAAGYPLNVLTNCPTRLNPMRFREPFAFNLEINGRCIDYDLDFVDFTTEKTEQNLHAMLTLDSRLVPVRLQVHTILDGTQMFTRYITIENLSDEALTVSRMAVMAGGIEAMDMIPRTYNLNPSTYYSVGYFDNDNWGREGEFNWHVLEPGVTDIDTRFYRNRYRHPFMVVRNNVDGTLYFSQIAWSAGCRYTLDLKVVREDAHKDFIAPSLSFKAEILGHNPILVLKAGEVFTTPEVHMGAIQGDLDDAVNEMHAHVRTSVLNLPEADPSDCLIGCGMGAEHDMSVECSKAYIDQFAEMGGEIFIIDAGWQNPPHKEMAWLQYNGINRPDPDRYPNGLAEVSDYCHAKGMKFAMWVEIERIGTQSNIFTEKPEWRVPNVYGKPWGENQFLLDFTNPEAAQWAEDELARIITEYKLDLLRVDYNIGPNDYFNVRDISGEGIKECVSLRHFQAVYRMYENLKKRFPNVLFENCAGGGGRTDLGIMKAFHHTWVSDWQKMPHSVMITSGMTMVLPPERVDRLFAGMGCHSFGSFDAHMRNVMLGHMSLNVVTSMYSEANPLQMEFIKHSVQIYKDFIRPILPTCKIYHHTPEVYKAVEEGKMVLEIASPDGAKGAMTVFTLSGTADKVISVMPRGLDAGRTYRVTMDNTGETFTVSGRDLKMQGLTVGIPTSMASELITFEAIE